MVDPPIRGGTARPVSRPEPGRGDPGQPQGGTTDRQVRLNAAFWSGGSALPEYASRDLLPVEVVLLLRHHRAVTGRVLDLGCGAGRLLGYLAEVSREAHGIDIAPAMVEYCRRNYPRAQTHLGDIAELGGLGLGTFDAVFAINNLFDVLDDARRRAALRDVRDLLAPEGLLIFSSHNLDVPQKSGAGRPQSRRDRGRAVRQQLVRTAARPPADVARGVLRLAARRRNRRRLAHLQYRGSDYAILNDRTHDYRLLHYYIGRDSQERQLREGGYELVEVLDAAGRPVPPGTMCHDAWLHYVARRGVPA